MAIAAIKKEELHAMTDQAIVEHADRLRKRLFELRSQAVTERLENPREMGNIKRDVARLLTEQNMRKVAAQKAANQAAEPVAN